MRLLKYTYNIYIRLLFSDGKKRRSFCMTVSREKDVIVYLFEER